MLHQHHFLKKSLCLILTLSLLLLTVGCGRQAIGTDISPVEVQEESSANVSSNTISSAEHSEPPHQVNPLTDKEQALLSTQAELLTKQIVSAFYPKLSPQLPEQSEWKADGEIIERFWLTIGIYDKEPHYPYPNTYQISSDGVLRLSKETLHTINKELFGTENWEPTFALTYNSEKQTYEYTIGFGVSAYGFEKMTAAFQNNDSELAVSYELWSDPNFPMYQKIDEYQTLFSVKQREDGSHYLQYAKTEKPAEAD